jgi:hypothetical protein
MEELKNMGILKYIMTGNPRSDDINNYKKEQEKFEKNLNKFMQNRRTNEVLNEYNFEPDKLKDIIERYYRLGIYNIVSILNRVKFLRIFLDIYTKAPDDWTEEDKFIGGHNFLNKYNIYK